MIARRAIETRDEADASSIQPPPASGVRLAGTSADDAELCYAGAMAGGVTEADPLADVAAARAGDAAATRRILKAVAPTVLAVARAVLGSNDRDLEDVVQESLVGVVNGLATFRGDASIAHYARSIALRRALDHRRSRARRGISVELDEDDHYAPSSSPAGNVVAARRRAAFRGLLSSLAPEQAEALARRVLLGYAVDEIASEMGAPIETIRSRLRLAKAALRERITNDPELLELSEMDDDDAS